MNSVLGVNECYSFRPIAKQSNKERRKCACTMVYGCWLVDGNDWNFGQGRMMRILIVCVIVRAVVWHIQIIINDDGR